MSIFLNRDRVGDRDAGSARIVDQKGNPLLVFLSIVISLGMSACGEQRYTQCEQIFQIAHSVTNTTRKINSTSTEQLQEMKSWLQAAALITKAAQQLKSLPLNDAELIEYQASLADVYQIYSQATYDAVKARESKNIDALLVARSHVKIADKRQQLLIEEINDYCVCK